MADRDRWNNNLARKLAEEARLTPEMKRLLDTTDIAYGRAVQTLMLEHRAALALPDGPP